MPQHEAAIGEAADAAEAASNSRVLDVVARWGFAVMALLHIVIGAIAVALVLGAPAVATAAATTIFAHVGRLHKPPRSFSTVQYTPRSEAKLIVKIKPEPRDIPTTTLLDRA